MKGDPAQGERVFRMGCGLCHGRTTARVDPGSMNGRQWTRHFASGSHGRHTPLRSNFTLAELANVKAYLVSVVGSR